MKSISVIALSTIAAGVFFVSGGSQPLHASFLSAGSSALIQERGWDEPPAEFDEVSRKGFHDGVEGARKDFGNHRAPSPENRDEFRHPHVPDRDKEAYRHGFQRGYQIGWDHISHER